MLQKCVLSFEKGQIHREHLITRLRAVPLSPLSYSSRVEEKWPREIWIRGGFGVAIFFSCLSSRDRLSTRSKRDFS